MDKKTKRSKKKSREVYLEAEGEKEAKSVEVRAAPLNVVSITGEGRELVDMMERRKVDILCVQGTKWKGSKARSIGGGFKLLYHGMDGRRDGVGIILKEDYAKSIVEVKRKSDRIMSVKMKIEGVIGECHQRLCPTSGM